MGIDPERSDRPAQPKRSNALLLTLVIGVLICLGVLLGVGLWLLNNALKS